MKARLHLLGVSAFALCSSATPQTPPYKDIKVPVEQRVQDLLSRMTTEEKIAQLRSDLDPNVYGQALKTTGFGFIPIYNIRGLSPYKVAERINEYQRQALQSRLGIPTMIYEEALHGVIDNGHTSFPQAIAFAATWDPDLVHQVSTAIADEAKANGIRQVLSPVINVVRDARWGRVEETYGEDPLLTAKIGVAFISGFESNGVVTTPKHYVANLWDGGRDSHSVQISMRSLFDTYMLPFEAAFKEGGARSVMCSYNALNGVPTASDPWLLTEVLRGQYGFKGYVVSDWGAAGNVLDRFHQVATPEQCAAALLNAGMDSEAPGVYIFGKPLEDAVKHGLISPKTLDESVSRILRVKFETGLFDSPIIEPSLAAAEAVNPTHRELARKVAERSIVLLKNEKDLLPLRKNLRRVAVFGDMANAPVPLGGYSGTGNREERKTILRALEDKVPGATFDYIEGMTIGGASSLPVIPRDVLTSPSGGKGLLGEYFANDNFSGTPALSRVDASVDFNWGDDSPNAALPADNYTVRWTGFVTAPETGTYRIAGTSDDGIRVWIDGQLVVEDWSEHSASTATGRIRLTKGQKMPIKIEYFEKGGEAVAKVGWQREGTTDSVTQRFRQAAEAADACLVFAGIREGEGQDRAYLKLPGNQEEIIAAAVSSGKPVVVVLVAGAPVTMEEWGDRVPAILDAWYPGQEGADAIASVLFGDVNPSGKLPISFPRTVGQCPIYYNIEPSGRGYDYTDSSGKPLYAFGHGLSYTHFEYSNLKITGAEGSYTVTADVANTGKVDGTEVAQLYIHDEVSSVMRPLIELKGFQAVALKAGERKTLTFALGFNELSMYDLKMQRVVEPGDFKIMVGSASDDIRLTGTLTVPKAITKP